MCNFNERTKLMQQVKKCKTVELEKKIQIKTDWENVFLLLLSADAPFTQFKSSSCKKQKEMKIILMNIGLRIEFLNQ